MIRAVVGIALAATVLWLAIDWLNLSNEVTVHFMFCNGTRTATGCNGKEETANPTTYKVFIDQQAVIYWSWNSSEITRFTFCAVRDTMNWSCKFEEANEIPTREVRMIRGEYLETAEPPRVLPEIFYPASRWHWWFVYLTEAAQA